MTRKGHSDQPRLVVGIDEAGFGPRLGPLVVTRTAFVSGSGSLEEKLAAAVSRNASARGSRLRVDDSKQIYKGRKGLDTLEKTALSFWCTARGAMPGRLEDLLAPVLAKPLDLTAAPWYGALPLALPLPVAARREEISPSQRLLAETCRSAEVRFAGFRSCLIPEPCFNDGVEVWDSKARFLAELVLDLIGSLPDSCSDLDVEIYVDKLGGRNRYGEILASRLDPASIETEEESRALSRYIAREKGRTVSIEFVRSGDSKHLPVALASIFSKYLREIFMILFNTFWKRHQPGIRPTAGYPLDASRFLDEITRTAEEAGVDLAALVRQR